MMSSQSGKDPKLDTFDRTKPFTAIRGNPTVGFMQNRCAFDARAKLLPEVAVGMVGGKHPDGVKFFLDGEPYLGDGNPFKEAPVRAPVPQVTGEKPQLKAVVTEPRTPPHDGHAVREADLAPPAPKRRGRRSTRKKQG